MMPKTNQPERISPTAHYTGYVWQRHDLSTPALTTREGAMLYHAFWPFNALSYALGGPRVSDILLSRHQAIDQLLTSAIDEGRVSQVLEVAAGYSPRGWRFKRKYGEILTYVEADLPSMADRKRGMLQRVPAAERPEVVSINALVDSGPLSLSTVCERFDRTKGLAIITEGLTIYLAHDDLLGMWRRFAGELRRFRDGLYLADLRPTEHARKSVFARALMLALSTFVRGRAHLHFENGPEAERGLVACGFQTATLHRTDAPHFNYKENRGTDFVQIVEAWT